MLERLRFEHGVVIAAVAGMIGVALLFGRRPGRPTEEEEQQQQGQSRSSARSGTLALYRLLQSQGARVARHEQRLDVPMRPVRVLFSVATRGGLDPEESEGLRSWIREGGTLIWLPRSLTSHDMPFLNRLGLEWVDEGGDELLTTVTVDATPVRRDLGSGYRVQVGRTARLRPLEGADAQAQPLGADAAGWAVAMSRVGRGRAIVFVDPAVARNERLLKEDHSVLLAHLALACADGQTIAFDEYHHGLIGGTDSLGYLMETPAGGLLIHLAVAGILLLLATGRRLGPAREMHEERRRRPVEFVEAFARLCRASRAAGLAAELVVGNVTESLQRRFGGADAAVIEREAARRGLDPKKARRTFEAARLSTRGRPAPGELVRVLRELEQLRRRLLGPMER